MSLNARGRVLYGSPLSSPKIAKLVAIALAVLVVISTSALMRGFFSQLSPAAFQVFLIGLAGSLLMAILPLAILRFLDRREPESRWLYAIALLWGALIATGLALPINGAIFANIGNFVKLHPEVQALFGPQAQSILGAPLSGPPVEEITKGAGILLLFWLLKAEFDGVRDGFIYGALVGIGFNLLEAPLYVTHGFLEKGDVPLYFQMADRFSLFGFGGHALFSGLFGMGLGLARQTTRHWLRYAAPVGAWLLGFSAHFLNNAVGMLLFLFFFLSGKPLPEESVAKAVPEVAVQPFLTQWLQHSGLRLVGFLPFFLIAGAMLWQSGLWERQVIVEALADEVEPAITPEEYQAVKGDRIFRTRHIQDTDRRTSGAIVRAQNKLAIRKWRVKQMGQAADKDPIVASWRDELVRLRNAKMPLHPDKEG
ncbi:MAG: PrsW family intramembrane metalloprotease [Oscillatoriaceae cyanobacterium Prado104]|jgi:RsiW-degrading membrane proteinase PrsW (M82 family)|nr:PrsW family intramembrane metalloprotease [Oscillatoriaceae cyanobacterium Prado104]